MGALAADSQEDCKTATAARRGSKPIAAPPRMDSSSLIYNACKIGIKKYLKQKYEDMDTHERGQLLTKFVHNAIDLLLPWQCGHRRPELHREQRCVLRPGPVRHPGNPAADVHAVGEAQQQQPRKL